MAFRAPTVLPVEPQFGFPDINLQNFLLGIDEVYGYDFTVLTRTLVDRLFINIQTWPVPGNMDVGIYSKIPTATNDYTRLISSGAQVNPGGGSNKGIPFAGTFLEPGRYLMAMVVDQATFRADGRAANAFPRNFLRNSPATPIPLPVSLTMTYKNDQTLTAPMMTVGRA